MAPTVPLQRADGANGPVRACRWRHRHAAGRYEPVLKWQMARAGQPVARTGSPGAPPLCTITARGYLRHHQPPGPPAHTTANQPKRLKLTALDQRQTAGGTTTGPAAWSWAPGRLPRTSRQPPLLKIWPGVAPGRCE